MSEKPVKVGIIGSGFMGKAHAECYQHLPHVRVTAISSRTEEKARSVAETFAIDVWTTDWREVVHSDNVDAVDITAPNHMHREIALEVIDAGKPFLIEKPLARNVGEARDIVLAARRRGLPAVYGENIRFSPAAVMARDIIEQGGIGDVIMIRATEVHNGPFHSDWFWDAQLTGGGAVIDMGIHGLYLLEWMAGARVKRVYAELGTLKWVEQCRNGAEDSAFVMVRFENGAMAELLNSWAVAGGRDVRAEIYGTEGTIHLDKARGEGGLLVFSQHGYGPPVTVESSVRPHVSSRQGWHFPTPDIWNMHGHAHEVRHFVDVVRQKATPICTLEQGLRALELVEAIYTSGREGRPVLL